MDRLKLELIREAEQAEFEQREIEKMAMHIAKEEELEKETLGNYEKEAQVRDNHACHQRLSH